MRSKTKKKLNDKGAKRENRKKCVLCNIAVHILLLQYKITQLLLSLKLIDQSEELYMKRRKRSQLLFSKIRRLCQVTCHLVILVLNSGYLGV